MRPSVHGIHHVTAIAGSPRENHDFYTGVLGMRLVKKSVNQDAPDTYHLFYADAAGTPGTDLTFFPWPEMGPARHGPGTATRVSFAVRLGSLPYWRERLDSMGGSPGPLEVRFGENVMPFQDPHGLPLALVETGGGPAVPWARSPVPAEHQLLGFHSVRLAVRVAAETEGLLGDEMGFSFSAEEAGIRRHETDGGGPGKIVELVERPDERRGEWGTGGVHHVAWRVRHPEEEDLLRASLARAGRNPTPPIDRFWFRSVYFREPGGVLFELATDGPGFAVDEEEGRLGERLVLPPWLEGQREEIEASLPPLETTGPPPSGGPWSLDALRARRR